MADNKKLFLEFLEKNGATEKFMAAKDDFDGDILDEIPPYYFLSGTFTWHQTGDEQMWVELNDKWMDQLKENL